MSRAEYLEGGPRSEVRRKGTWDSRDEAGIRGKVQVRAGEEDGGARVSVPHFF